MNRRGFLALVSAPIVFPILRIVGTSENVQVTKRWASRRVNEYGKCEICVKGFVESVGTPPRIPNFPSPVKGFGRVTVCFGVDIPKVTEDGKLKYRSTFEYVDRRMA